MKRTMTLLVCLMTALLSFAYDFEAYGIYYNITSSSERLTVEVTEGSPKYTGSVTIPETVTYKGKTYSVTSMGSEAFSGCGNLTSIVFDKGNTVYDSRVDCNAIIETKTNTLIAGCQNSVIQALF